MTKPNFPPAKLDIRYGSTPIPPPEGLLYVPQANYVVTPMFQKTGPTYLYSDSATSCIIVICEGNNGKGDCIASLAHLDSPDCIKAYFYNILDVNFVGTVYFYAQGANPPGDPSSTANADMLNSCLNERASGKFPWIPDIQHLGLGEGDPRVKDRGDYGISIMPEVPIVSTQPFELELLDRDPTGGEQTLFCIMRRQLTPVIQLWNVDEAFPPSLVAKLVTIASTYQKDPNDPTTAFTYIINLTSDEVRNTWSTTPQYEASWFSDELKQSCCFTLVYLANPPKA
jgi:hypothetical protein